MRPFSRFHSVAAPLLAPPLDPGAAVVDLAARVLGRYQGPEYIYGTTVTMAALQTVRPSNPIPLGRALESLKVIWRGRLVIGTANYTTGVPEAPQSLIERIRITGNHSRWGNQVLVDITGATAFAALRCYQVRGNIALNGTTLIGDLSSPMPTTGIAAGATGTYDLELHYEIPMAPWGAWNAAMAIPYLWREENFGNSLQIEITVGDRTSLGTPAGGSTTTWTAFGSAAGSPSVEVYGNYAMLGPLQGVGDNGLVMRSEIVATPALTGVTSGIQLGAQLRKIVTTNLLLKTGIMLTGTSSGVNVFASLSDVQLNRTRLMAAQKPLKDLRSNYATKAYYATKFGVYAPQGYLPFSWIEGGQIFAALQGQDMPDGAQFNLETDVLTADANNRQQWVQEMIYGGPFNQR
jgi:hypothetical protein